MTARVKSIIALLCLAFCVMVACKHEPTLPQPVSNNDTTSTNPADTTNTDTTIVTPVDTTICFERDILPIFLSNCARGGCHDAASHEEGYILDNYANIMGSPEGDDDDDDDDDDDKPRKDDHKGIVPFNANKSEIYKSLIEDDIDDRMPEYPNPALSAEQINLIKRWINEGAKNGTNCVVLCDTNNVGYNSGIKPMMQQNCIGCHNNSLMQGGVNLSNYIGVHTVALNGKLLGTIRHQAGYVAMPQGAAKLSDCKIRQVEKWISAGAPEN